MLSMSQTFWNLQSFWQIWTEQRAEADTFLKVRKNFYDHPELGEQLTMKTNNLFNNIKYFLKC